MAEQKEKLSILVNLFRRGGLAGVKHMGMAIGSFTAAAGWYGFTYVKDTGSTWWKDRANNAQMKEHLGVDVNLRLSELESSLLSELVSTKDLSTSFDDIGGLKEVIRELEETVLDPLRDPYFYKGAADLLAVPSGVLLYGPPGTGKTTLAKAIAGEAGGRFMNIRMSTLNSKWHGESEKLVAAIFSLAKKLQPMVIFIDEIDGLMGIRRDTDQQHWHSIKSEFMTLWDGLKSADPSGKRARIVVLGATNRRDNIDDACLSRMPKQFHIGLPNVSQREQLLTLFLRGVNVDEKLDKCGLARAMEGLSGRQIQACCREAAMVPVREANTKAKADASNQGKRRYMDAQQLRAVATCDFMDRDGRVRAVQSKTPQEEVESGALGAETQIQRAF